MAGQPAIFVTESPPTGAGKMRNRELPILERSMIAMTALPIALLMLIIAASALTGCANAAGGCGAGRAAP